MKVYIRNKVISLGGSSEVFNENNETLFKVKGKIFTFTKKKKMYDINNALLYTIRNKYWTFMSRQVMIKDANGDIVARIKKDKHSLNCDYEILDTDDEMSIDGKFFSRSSHIMKNGKPVATINREISLIKDAFSLEAEENDIAFYTALVIGFDNLTDRKEKL